MENISVAQAMGTQSAGLRSMLGLGGGQQISGDPFAMIFQQMTDGDGENVLDMLFSQLTGEDNKKDANQMAMQMMAEMLFSNPALLPMLQAEQPAVAEAMLAELGNVRGITDIVGELVEQQILTDAQPEENPLESKENMTQQEFYSVLQNAWKEEQQPTTMGFSLQHNAVREAKQLLAQRPKEENTQALDVESLQAAVDQNRFSPFEKVLEHKEFQLPDTNEIAQQVKGGILDNVAKGKNEFIVKLEPEGIGEIVVKLSENKDRISLTIFTASEQTAKMISNEVAALQNSLRPLNAQVEQIITAPDAQSAAFAAQTALADQNSQSNRQFMEDWQRYQGSEQQQDGEEFSDMVVQPEDRLDTYI